MDDNNLLSNKERAAEIKARKEKLLDHSKYKKEAPSYRKQLTKHLDYLSKTNESRAHKQLATFFKNRDIANRAFNKKPEEQKEVPKMTEPKKLKEAEVKLRTPSFNPGDQEQIMSSDSLPNVNAATNLTPTTEPIAGETAATEKAKVGKPLSKTKVKKVAEAKDVQEYDYEGQMAKEQLRTICRNAEALMDHLTDTENLPEWIQTKITLSEDYITTCANYMMSKVDEAAMLNKKAETPASASTAAEKAGMAKARALAQKGMSQMKKLSPKMERHLAYAFSSTYTESLNESLPVHAIEPGPEVWDDANATATDMGAEKTYPEQLSVGDLVQCLRTNRIGRVIAASGTHTTVEYYPGTEKSETEHGHADWYQKLTDEDPQHFHTARSTTDKTDYPHMESANHTGEVLTEATREGERSWNIKGLKVAGHGIIGKKVRSYDFPGFNDSHYMEGHVIHETPYSYHVRTTKVVRSGKEHPIGVHNHQFEAPKGKHLFYGAAGVYHTPKEGHDVNGSENPRARRTFGTVRVSTHQKKR
jgi:hypothetical protein